jgi:hypothetical protein
VDWRADEERRRATRYKFAGAVQLKNGSMGRIRDMSTCGLFFEAERPHAAGETIRFTVALDGSTLQCEGRIVRVEQLEDLFGMAVELLVYDFC